MKQLFSIFPFVVIPVLVRADEAEDIRGIKDVVDIPQPPNYLLWAIIFLLMVAVAVGIWKWLTKKQLPPGVSAANVALSEIQAAEKLIPGDDPEPFTLKVTDAIRHYIEKRFDLAAPRRTTEEFLREIHNSGAPGFVSYQEELGDFLKCCDAVKFGRAELATEDRRQLIASARNFVQTTTDDRG